MERWTIERLITERVVARLEGCSAIEFFRSVEGRRLALLGYWDLSEEVIFWRFYRGSRLPRKLSLKDAAERMNLVRAELIAVHLESGGVA